ncbi:MAG: hypothetical protein ACRENC_19785 [Gemmatimonadaceae bacterium]
MRLAPRSYLVLISIPTMLLVSACAGVIRPNDQAVTQAAMADAQRATEMARQADQLALAAHMQALADLQRAANAAAMAAAQASVQVLTPPPR